MEISTIITSILIPLIVAVLATLITAYISLRQFRKERVWELKVEYYESIFDAVYAFDRKYRYKIHEETTAEELDDEDAQDLIDELNDATWELERIIFQGSFIVDQKAIELLRQLNGKLKSEEPPTVLFGLFKSRKRFDYFKTRRQDINTTMKKLREIANDLYPKNWRGRISDKNV